ncbi:acetylcholinesterase-like [Dermacentor variabilis]|uniref:acetylcholinesterase-like n=1 Tax=Dermacentor variabilis TaxID=34621 RepID=UPI003F5C6603
MATSAALLAGLLVAVVLTVTADESFVERQTTEGMVRGKVVRVLDKSVEEYRGIPFAEPPLGKLRFRPPLPKQPWEGTVDATAGNTACPQVLLEGITMGNLSFTEDCLQLNVWVPEVANDSGSRRPVLVWIHGGAFTFGSANTANCSGVLLAALIGVVVVSMNYRLGILGFMNVYSSEAPGNVGLLDQNMALKWVQRNIGHFGGDPERVTLFGEGAGSMSVHTQIMSPLSRRLFKRAVLMSGTMYSRDTWDTVYESIVKAYKVANVLGCSNSARIGLSPNVETIVDCMRNKSADELSTASLVVAAPKMAPFLPTYSNKFLPQSPLGALKRGFFSSVDVLAGVTLDEGAAFLLFPLVPELLVEDLQGSPPEELVKSLRSALWRRLKENIRDILETYTKEAPKDDNNALRRQYIDYLSDRLFNCPLQFFAEKHSEKDNKVFTYVFTHKTAMFPLPGWMGAPHGSDVAFAFGHPYAVNPDSPDGRMAEAFVRMLASFGENGIPELPDNESWPRYSKSSPSMMVLNNGHFNETQGFRSSYCERWRPLY